VGYRERWHVDGEWVTVPGDSLANRDQDHSVEEIAPRTPAMAAGVDHVWTCEEIAALLD
jgi:hypothetical protein